MTPAGAVVVEVRLLGRPAVLVDGGWIEPPPGRATAVLLYLAFHGGWVSRDDLVYLFWPDTPEARARGNLRPLLWRLQREAYARGLERDRTRVRWPVPTDLQRFRRAVDAGRWSAAWERGRADLLAGFRVLGASGFDAWLEAERAMLRPVIRTAGLETIAERVSAHEHGAAAAVAAALHRADPLDEIVVRSYLANLARSGSRREALAAFERFRQVLDEEVGAEPEPATLAIVEALRSGSGPADGETDTRSVEPPGGDGAAHAVMPLQPTRFVGRAHERAEVGRRLMGPECRLMTIVGPGGVGKTRLAIELGSDLGPRFRHGARFVDLAGVSDADGMTAAIAHAVGAASPVHGDAAEHLHGVLRDKEMVLVLDNVEHLVDQRAVIAAVLARSRSVKVLATSRVRLALPGERLFELAGLRYEVPADGSGPADAVTLFTRCARRVAPRLAVGPAESRCIARICALAEGLPLALELSATWLRVLTLDEIAAELAAGRDLLMHVDHGGSERHAGMHAAFTHSWDLLRPREREALRALSVFHGGWTREAASAVAGVGVPVLLALVDASLIRRSSSGRFGWHPLVGSFAGARADEHGDERERSRALHAHFYLAFVAERANARTRYDGGRLLAEIDADVANVMAAWDWAVEHRHEDLLAAASTSLWAACFASNRLRLVRQALRRALAIATPGGMLAGRAAMWLGSTLCNGSGVDRLGRRSGSEEGLGLLEGAVSTFTAFDAAADRARALQELGCAYARAGRSADSRRTLELGLAAYRSLGDRNGVATMTSLLAEFEPDFGRAVEGFRTAIALGVADDLPMPIMAATEGLASRLYLGFGAYDEAAEAMRQAIDVSERMSFRHWTATGRVKLGRILATAGALEPARAVLVELGQGLEAGGSDSAARDEAEARSLLAWIGHMEGDVDGSLAACRQVLEVGDGTLAPETEARCRTLTAAVAIERGDLAGAAADLARARSRLASASRVAFGQVSVPVEDVPLWLRMLTGEVSLRLASALPCDAHQAALEALAVARGSGQWPAATIALAVAADVAAAAGEPAAASDLARFVADHVATPYDVRLRTRAPFEGRPDGAGRGPQTGPRWGVGAVVSSTALHAVLGAAGEVVVWLRGQASLPAGR